MAAKVTFIVGNSNIPLFRAVAEKAVNLLMAIGSEANMLLPRKSTEKSNNTYIVELFSNGEVHIEIDKNIRGHTVYVMQTGDGNNGFSINDNLMVTRLLISACKRANAKEVIVMTPSYFYARQDKKDRPRVPISAYDVAEIFETAGASRIIAVDLHSAQTQGFAKIPMDNLYASRYIRAYLEQLITNSRRPRDDFVLVSPDLGGEKRIRAFADAMKLPFILAAKGRDHTKASVVDHIHVYSNGIDTVGKIGIIIDDMIDTAGTILALFDSLKICGLSECWVAVTHGILSGPAVARLMGADLLTRVICTNTLNRSNEKLTKLEIVDISDLLARVVYLTETDSSISALFETAEAPTPLMKATMSTSNVPALEIG